MCVWLKKNPTVLVYCIHKRVKSIVFAVSIKFCDEPGQAILSKVVLVLWLLRGKNQEIMGKVWNLDQRGLNSNLQLE